MAPPATASHHLRSAGRALASLVLLALAAWSAAALWYQLPLGVPWRIAAATLMAGSCLLSIALWWRGHGPVRGRAVPAWLACFAALLVWWHTLTPSNQRQWADDVARMPAWSRSGDVVTLTNVRNFDWRSDTDYTPRWENRRYDLSQLRGADVAMSYWMGPAIAHTLVSFGFDDGRHLVFSIEIRKRRGEAFSGVAGFFKHFEMVLVAADERDILRVRTNVRGEDMYLYQLRMPPADLRALFLAYLGEADQLRAQPRFYNTLTANCTTIVYQMARHIEPGMPLDWRLLASGYLDRYLFDIGGLDRGTIAASGSDFTQLRASAHITARALAADHDADFSQAIRRGR